MKLKKSWRFREMRCMFTVAYLLALATYLFVGLAPATAADYEVATDIQIPSIGLISDVTTIRLANNQLDTPDTIVGRYAPMHNKTFLFGHASTVFVALSRVGLGDEIYYDETRYYVREIEVKRKHEIEMGEILAATDKETIVIMTCAGEDLGGGDASHRLIITATAE